MARSTQGGNLGWLTQLRGRIVPMVCAWLIITAAGGVSAAEREWSREWVSVHGNVANQRYAAIDQINTKNIGQLGAVWISQPFADAATSQMTPLVHDGLMFLGAGPRIYALDARTGKPVWVRQTTVGKPTGSVFDVAYSGLAITRSWGLSLGGGMVFTGMMNGHVTALDANENPPSVALDGLTMRGMAVRRRSAQ